MAKKKLIVTEEERAQIVAKKSDQLLNDIKKWVIDRMSEFGGQSISATLLGMGASMAFLYAPTTKAAEDHIIAMIAAAKEDAERIQKEKMENGK